jgi:hypothetical protein
MDEKGAEEGKKKLVTIILLLLFHCSVCYASMVATVSNA